MARVMRKEQAGVGNSPLIGELLHNAGSLTDEQIDQVVVAQQERGLRFGEAALQLGFVGQEDLRRALSLQFDFAYAREGESTLHSSLYTAYEPFGAQAEALRTLRSQLKLRWFTDKHKVLAVIAARAGAGCSSVAANLAVSFSQTGERTLLIDGNLRAPRQQHLFGLQASEGFTAVLGGRASLGQVVASVPSFPTLSVLLAGAMVPNPQELLSRLTFSYLMETLPASYDIVIVDCPPVLGCADAQLIAAQAGGCLLVTQKHRTRLDDIEQVKEALEPARATLLGAVMLDT